MRKKGFNEHAIDKMSFLGAYFLGAMFSDGCVCSTTKGRFTICLGMKDKDVIVRFNKFFNSKNKIKLDDKGRYSTQMCSKHLFNVLNRYGCVERKSLIIGIPKINKKYYYSFILGVIDGDGGISLNRSINSWKMSIGTGSLHFFTWLKEVFNKTPIRYSVGHKKTKANKDFYSITFIGLSAKAIMNLLHKNSKIVSMDRKLKLLKQLNKVKFKYGPKVFPWELKVLKMNSNDKECSKLISKDKRNYGWIRSPDTIYHIRRYHNIEAFK